MPVQLITPPAAEPITLQQAKDHLRLETAFDDAQVNGAILGARMYVEEICWRGLVTQVWELVLERFPGETDCYGALIPGSSSPFGLSTHQAYLRAAEGIEVPKGNLVSVGSVKYLEPAAGAVTTLASSEYLVDTVSVPGRIRLAYGKSWPAHRAQWDAIRIQYTVGWAAEAVPQPIKQAMLLLISHLYENRTLEVPGRLTPVQFAVDSLLAPYRLARHT